MEILALIRSWAVRIGAIIVAIGTALLYGLWRGSKAGKAEIQAEDAKATVKAVETANTARQDTASKSDDEVQSQLRNQWSRKEP